MKILFIIPSLAKGGQEKAGMIITNYLSLNHNVLVVALEPANDFDFAYQSPIERIEVERKTSSIGKFIVSIKRIQALKKIKKNFKPDISITFGETAIIPNILSFSTETKIHSIRHSHTVIFNDLSNFRKYFLKFLFKRADILVGVSKAISEEIENLFGIKKNKIFAHNGYDLELIQKLTNANPIINRNVLAHVGRFHLSKCHWHLCKTYILAKKQQKNLKLLLIGEVDYSNPISTTIYNFCKNYLQSNGCIVEKGLIEGNINFDKADVFLIGHQLNPFQFLTQSNLFIFPSFIEGFPNALVEAMVCGLPVISADCETGPKEILIDEKTNEEYGILMPVFDHKFDENDFTINQLHQQWADKIISLLSDKDKLIHYKRQSLKRAKDFSIEKSCQKWLDIIENKI